jgi:hypothetical protein
MTKRVVGVGWWKNHSAGDSFRIPSFQFGESRFGDRFAQLSDVGGKIQRVLAGSAVNCDGFDRQNCSDLVVGADCDTHGVAAVY